MAPASRPASRSRKSRIAGASCRVSCRWVMRPRRLAARTKHHVVMRVGRCRQPRRVGGSAADASIVNGADIAPDDLEANHHRVGGIAANPTSVWPTKCVDLLVYTT